MNKLIEKLKDKNYVRPFGLMTLEEQECFRKVGAINCLFYNYRGKWETLTADTANFMNCNTYAINPDYYPEPEYVDYLIEICEEVKCEEGHFLGVKKKLDNSPILPHEHTYLYALPSLPNFAGFWIGSTNLFKIAYEEVAGKVYQGKTVYARFRKGEH